MHDVIYVLDDLVNIIDGMYSIRTTSEKIPADSLYTIHDLRTIYFEDFNKFTEIMSTVVIYNSFHNCAFVPIMDVYFSEFLFLSVFRYDNNWAYGTKYHPDVLDVDKSESQSWVISSFCPKNCFKFTIVADPLYKFVKSIKFMFPAIHDITAESLGLPYNFPMIGTNYIRDILNSKNINNNRYTQLQTDTINNYNIDLIIDISCLDDTNFSKIDIRYYFSYIFVNLHNKQKELLEELPNLEINDLLWCMDIGFYENDYYHTFARSMFTINSIRKARDFYLEESIYGYITADNELFENFQQVYKPDYDLLPSVRNKFVQHNWMEYMMHELNISCSLKGICL